MAVYKLWRKWHSEWNAVRRKPVVPMNSEKGMGLQIHENKSVGVGVWVCDRERKKTKLEESLWNRGGATTAISKSWLFLFWNNLLKIMLYKFFKSCRSRVDTNSYHSNTHSEGGAEEFQVAHCVSFSPIFFRCFLPLLALNNYTHIREKWETLLRMERLITIYICLASNVL